MEPDTIERVVDLPVACGIHGLRVVLDDTQREGILGCAMLAPFRGKHANDL
jgi:hypothetical protein